jgi:putative transposase
MRGSRSFRVCIARQVNAQHLPRVSVPDVKRLKALEDENGKLKRLLAEQMLDAAAMKELLAKKW